MLKKVFLFCFILPLPSLLLVGCTHLKRSSTSGYSDNRSTKKEVYIDQEMQKTAYELGFDPSSSLSSNQISTIQDRQQLRRLERNLTSKKEKEQYSKILPWLQSDKEKLSFLSIPSLEGRQLWINSNNIWKRSQIPQKEYKELVDNQDISVGMPLEMVKKSWGEPQSVEISGNPIYKNERWKYLKDIPTTDGFKKETRIVYFEGGRVVGWDTE